VLREESIWIKNVLKETDLSPIKEILDVGSSTKEFRTKIQPYIDKNVFKPLRQQNKSIYYLDQKNDEGIDFVCNMKNMDVEEIGKKFDLVVCCNVLEHVHNPGKLASSLMGLINQNGLLLVTVPQVYRYHPDPIDTMFRPTMNEMVSMFPGLEILRSDVVRIRDKEKYHFTEFFRYIIPFLNWQVNCLFMKKVKL
jgi:SAM-dependent methyltransferase